MNACTDVYKRQTWILAAVISFVSFTAFRWTDKKQGYQLSSFVEKEDASLNFFMTMIIPLLIDDESSFRLVVDNYVSLFGYGIRIAYDSLNS